MAAKLKDTYTAASAEARAVIDDMFITLTGWSFATLLDKERAAHDADDCF
jgi:hypothetical protein